MHYLTPKILVISALSVTAFALTTPNVKPRQNINSIQFSQLKTTALDYLVGYEHASCSGPVHFPTVDNLLWNCWNFPPTTDSIGILWPQGKLPQKDHRINYRVYKGPDCQGALSTGFTFFSDYVKDGGWNRSSIPNACVPNSYFASGETWASVEYFPPTVILGQDSD